MWLLVLWHYGVDTSPDAWPVAKPHPELQYLGLALYTVAEAVIFCRYCSSASRYFDPKVIPIAGIMDPGSFRRIDPAVFSPAKTSYCGRSLACEFSALGVIVARNPVWFQPRLFFSFAMVALMSGYILYYTPRLHHYRPPSTWRPHGAVRFRRHLFW